MPAPRLGVDLTNWPSPLKRVLPMVAELGAVGVVLDARGEIRPEQFGRTAVRQLRKMLEDLNLRVAAVRFRTRRGYATTEELDRRVHATKAAMELAYSLGASVVLGAIGSVPPPQSDARQLLVEVLTDLGLHGQRVGAMLAAETGEEGGQPLAGLLAELPDATLGVDFSPGQMVLGGQEPLPALESLAAWILHVSATDATGRRGPNRALPTLPGEGAVDWPALLSTLEERAYRGCITVPVLDAEEPLRQAARGLQYFRTL